ncbi:hypothetical protein HGA64_05755 [Candidatus Falkowbacteria bacterium]|nr:hypothetical protein [Candidatus Falkowbacteria bacterium]
MKEFFKITKFKLSIFIALLLFFPSLFINLGFVGFGSLTWLLLETEFFIPTSGNIDWIMVSLVVLVFVVQTALQSYLIACLMEKYLKKKVTYSLLAILILLAVFAPIYNVGDVGGGKHSTSLLQQYKDILIRHEESNRAKVKEKKEMLNDMNKVCRYIYSHKEYSCLDHGCTATDQGAFWSVRYYCSGGDMQTKPGYKILLEVDKESGKITNKGLVKE